MDKSIEIKINNKVKEIDELLGPLSTREKELAKMSIQVGIGLGLELIRKEIK